MEEVLIVRKRKIGLLEVLFALIGLGLVVWFTLKSFEHSSRDHRLFKTAESQAEILEPLLWDFYQVTGRVPWSLVDRQPDGRMFVDLLPNGECFANPFTGRRTEPHFFNRLYKSADRGTIAVVVEDGLVYIVVYAEHRTLTHKLRW